MKHAALGIGSRVVIIAVATVTTMGLLMENGWSQRPGQLSSSIGKRWFSKNKAEKRTGGILSGRMESRRAHRKALRDQAVTEAEGAAAETKAGTTAANAAESGQASATSSRRSQAATSGSGSSSASAQPAPTRSSSGGKIKRRSPGRRGAGFGPIGKSRRTLLKPLFGN